MVGKIAGRHRPPVFGEIGRCRDGDHPRAHQQPRDQRGLRGIAEAHRHVHAVGHQIADLVAGDDLDLQLGIEIEKRAKPGSQNQSREIRIDIDPEPPAHRLRHARGCHRRLLDTAQQRRHLLVKAGAVVSQAHGAGGAVEQAQTDAAFQPGDGAADARRRQAHRVRRPREAAAFDHRRQYAHPVQQSSVEHRYIRDFQSPIQ